MIVVLGGGPAGRIASIRLASAGKEVTLVESGGIGGQCLHFGCMPVCALTDVARTLNTARTYQHLGIIDAVPEINFPRLVAEMQAIQQKIAGVLHTETVAAGVNIIYGKTGKIDGNRVFVGDELVTADAVIAATGSRPNIPSVDGISLPGVFTPHSLPAIQALPKDLVIIGGSVMAAEFAYIFGRLGSNVTILCRSGLLKTLDKHLRTIAITELSGVEIRENARVLSIKGSAHVTAVVYDIAGRADSIYADSVLIAAGLVPRSEQIKGVEKGAMGEVIVNDRMQTSVPFVYACGDVTGPPYLTPVARHEGLVAADNILGRDHRMDYEFIPRSINLAHELAYCTTNAHGSASLAIPGPAGPGTFWSVPAGDTGLAKIMADPITGEITGMCAAGPGGGLIAGYLSFLMQRHITVHDFEEFIEVHPSTDGVYGLAKYTAEILNKRNAL
ncbi:MAG: NAD(P)/FAD-dependent oxidoreductase [Methanoregula sp.]|nr:NAD(P)/FAD-dependent oxidoreductase [Methanoregula sp.]